MTPTHILVHYGEIALKKGNRQFFEDKLKENIKKALGKKLAKSVIAYQGRFVIRLQKEIEIEKVIKRLQQISGIAYFAPAYTSEQNIETLKEDALYLMRKMPEFKTFRVSCRRTQKKLPFTSLDVERDVGGCIFHEMENIGVDLKNSEVVCNIELFDNQALIYTERIEGLRGLPVGTSGKVLCLISAGIDSPVAAFRMMRRGCKVAYVHFHSYPFTDKNSIYNAIKLVKQINPYQMHSKIYIISLAKIQERIIAMAPVKLRLLLYRRMMLRLAEGVAYRERAKALITGESLGQVASQTLMNLKATSDAVKLPILRPLIGYDKQHIIDIAKEIGTFQISIEPFTDCCTYMVPENPETHAKLKVIREAEENLGDYEELLYQAIGNMEIEVIE